VAGPGIWNLRSLGLGSKTAVSALVSQPGVEPGIIVYGFHSSTISIHHVLGDKRPKTRKKKQLTARELLCQQGLPRIGRCLLRNQKTVTLACHSEKLVSLDLSILLLLDP
jgi:hypothetical protein